MFVLFIDGPSRITNVKHFELLGVFPLTGKTYKRNIYDQVYRSTSLSYKDKYFNTYKVNVLSVKTLVVSSLLGPFLGFCFVSFIRLWSAFPSHASVGNPY